MRIIEIVSEDTNQLHYPKTNQAGAQAAQGVAGQVGQYRAFSTLVTNAEQVIPAIIKRNLPKLAQSAAGSIPGLGTILTLTWAAWDLAQGNYADSAMTAASAFTPPLTSLALMAGMITNDAYAGVYVDSRTGQPASLALDLQRDPSGTQQRLVELKNMIVQALGTLINQGRQRITGHQGAANARAAVRNYSTAGNPAPQQEGWAGDVVKTGVKALIPAAEKTAVQTIERPVIAGVRWYDRRAGTYRLFSQYFPSQRAAEEWAARESAEIHSITDAGSSVASTPPPTNFPAKKPRTVKPYDPNQKQGWLPYKDD